MFCPRSFLNDSARHASASHLAEVRAQNSVFNARLSKGSGARYTHSLQTVQERAQEPQCQLNPSLANGLAHCPAPQPSTPGSWQLSSPWELHVPRNERKSSKKPLPATQEPRAQAYQASHTLKQRAKRDSSRERSTPAGQHCSATTSKTAANLYNSSGARCFANLVRCRQLSAASAIEDEDILPSRSCSLHHVLHCLLLPRD